MGTTVVMLVAVGVPVTVARVPLNLTILLPAVVLKLVPMIVTAAPISPETGLKLVIAGGILTVKALELVAVRPFTSTVITPVVAPTGTDVTMLLAVGVPVIVATTPLNLTILLAAV